MRVRAAMRGRDVEVLAAGVARRGLDGGEQGARDAAPAGVLADDERDDPRSRSVVLEALPTSSPTSPTTSPASATKIVVSAGSRCIRRASTSGSTG